MPLVLPTPSVPESNEDFFAGNSSAISGAKIPAVLGRQTRISVLPAPSSPSAVNSSAQEESLDPLLLLRLRGFRSGTN
jgi:hypothetical protein